MKEIVITSTENIELHKDKERLDWILKNCDVIYDKFYSTSCSNREEVDNVMEGKFDETGM